MQYNGYLHPKACGFPKPQTDYMAAKFPIF